jgi:hypothetical protein
MDAHASDLIDMGNCPEIYADGLAEIQNLGSTARLVYFSWQRIDGVFRQFKVLSLIRPKESLATSSALIAAVAREAPPVFTALSLGLQ